MQHSYTPRIPRSLRVLQKKCLKLFEAERCVLACETEILIKKNGDVHPDKIRMFPWPYDLEAHRDYHYLWNELSCIETNIRARGYSQREVDTLENFMESMIAVLDNPPLALDHDQARALTVRNLLN